MTKELLFSVTKDDCRWDYYRGSGKGGQKKNKTSSAVRCTHIESGAVGQAEDTRSQLKNKQLAFERMAQTDKFVAWHKMKVAKMLGEEQKIHDAVENAMRPWNLAVEYFDPNE